MNAHLLWSHLSTQISCRLLCLLAHITAPVRATCSAMRSCCRAVPGPHGRVFCGGVRKPSAGTSLASAAARCPACTSHWSIDCHTDQRSIAAYLWQPDGAAGRRTAQQLGMLLPCEGSARLGHTPSEFSCAESDPKPRPSMSTLLAGEWCVSCRTCTPSNSCQLHCHDRAELLLQPTLRQGRQMPEHIPMYLASAQVLP